MKTKYVCIYPVEVECCKSESRPDPVDPDVCGSCDFFKEKPEYQENPGKEKMMGKKQKYECRHPVNPCLPGTPDPEVCWERIKGKQVRCKYLKRVGATYCIGCGQELRPPSPGVLSQCGDCQQKSRANHSMDEEETQAVLRDVADLAEDNGSLKMAYHNLRKELDNLIQLLRGADRGDPPFLSLSKEKKEKPMTPDENVADSWFFLYCLRDKFPEGEVRDAYTWAIRQADDCLFILRRN